MDEEKTGLIAGAAVLVAVAVGGVAMAVVRRTIGRASDPIVAAAEEGE